VPEPATDPIDASIGDSERFAVVWAEYAAAIRRARSRAADRPDAKLTPAQFHLLTALEDTPSLCVGDLARAAGVSSPTATRMLDGLEQDGIVKREPTPGDRRRTAVRATAKGRRALAETRERVDAAREQIYAQLSPDERAQAERLLPRLAEAIEQL
jgi:MarR family transcriptional regulator, organic hydroperoxide resistance regulator